MFITLLNYTFLVFDTFSSNWLPLKYLPDIEEETQQSLDISEENSYSTGTKIWNLNTMKANALNSLLFIISLIISFFIYDTFDELLELNLRQIENSKQPAEMALAYDQLNEKIASNVVTKKEIIEVFETIKASDISAFEYQESFSEVLAVYKSNLFNLLALQALILLTLWWSLTFPSRNKKE